MPFGFKARFLIEEVAARFRFRCRNFQLGAVIENHVGHREQKILGGRFETDDFLFLGGRFVHIGAAVQDHVPDFLHQGRIPFLGKGADSVQGGLHGTGRDAEGLDYITAQTQENGQNHEQNFHVFRQGGRNRSGDGFQRGFQFGGNGFRLLPVTPVKGRFQQVAAFFKLRQAFGRQKIAIVVDVAAHCFQGHTSFPAPFGREPGQRMIQKKHQNGVCSRKAIVKGS